MKININNREHIRIVLQYYYAHFNAKEAAERLNQNGYETCTDDVKLLYIRAKRHGMPKYNRNRIISTTLDEVNELFERFFE